MARVYGCPFGSAQMMDKRTKEIQTLVPPEKLLLFQVQEGWEPLCTFLGVPIPDVPFPHKNEKGAPSSLYFLPAGLPDRSRSLIYI